MFDHRPAPYKLGMCGVDAFGPWVGSSPRPFVSPLRFPLPLLPPSSHLSPLGLYAVVQALTPFAMTPRPVTLVVLGLTSAIGTVGMCLGINALALGIADKKKVYDRAPTGVKVDIDTDGPLPSHSFRFVAD